MSDKVQPPDLAATIEDVKNRLDKLERQLHPLTAAFKPDIVFSYGTDPSVSPPYTSREGRRVIEVVVIVTPNGSTDTEVSVQKNGVPVLVVTVPAGQRQTNVPCNIFLGADQDILHDEMVSLGTGVTNVTVIHRFRR